MSPSLLDSNLMEVYEDRLRDLEVPIDSEARSGLSEDQMRGTLAPLGLTLPVEGRVWWGWHDGAPLAGNHKPIAPAGDRFLSLAEAVETYREYRDIVRRGAEPDIPELANPDDRWHPAWLPIRGPQLPLVIDCSVAEGQPTPLRFIDLQDVGGSPLPRAQSLGEMVILWIAAIDNGAWRWDTRRAEWLVDSDLLDDEHKTSPLV